MPCAQGESQEVGDLLNQLVKLVNQSREGTSYTSTDIKSILLDRRPQLIIWSNSACTAETLQELRAGQHFVLPPVSNWRQASINHNPPMIFDDTNKSTRESRKARDLARKIKGCRVFVWWEGDELDASQYRYDRFGNRQIILLD